MSKRLKKQSSGKTLILIYDGACWHAGVPHSDGTWEQMHEPASAPDELPESILHWGLNAGALHLRAAVPAELIELETDGETDLTLLNPAELYQTLCYELSDKSGMEPEEIAPSAATFPSLNMGPDENRLMAAVFERGLVEEYNDQCEHHGLKFDGVTSLQGLALAAHSRTRSDPKEGLLFFGRKDAFVAGISGQEHVFSCRSIPMNTAQLVQSEENSRRLARRIKSFLNHPLHLIVPEGEAEAAEAAVYSIQECTLRCSEFPQLCTAWMKRLADASNYMLEGPVGLVSLPPKIKDAKYTGGVICAASILLTVLVVGGLWGGKAWQKHTLTALKGRIAALESAQKSAESAYNSVDSEINRVRRLYGSISSEPPKVNRHFSDIALALSRTLPKYSRITSVVQEKDCTRVTGATQWAQEVSRFAVQLQEELKPFGLRVVPMDMKPSETSAETLFEMEIR